MQLAGDIAKRLPEHVLTVGVFRDEAPQRVVEAVRMAGLGAAQLHGHETAEETQWVRARVHTVIKAFRAGERAIGRFEEFGADYLLVDGDNPGSGEVFDWRLAEGVADHRPPHRLWWPAARERRPGGGEPAAPRGGRVHRRRVGARAQGPAARAGLHRQRTAGQRPGVSPGTSWSTPRPRSPTTGGTDERRQPDGAAGSRRPVRRVRRPLRPRVADAGLPRAGEVVRRRLGGPGVPRPSSTGCCATTAADRRR